MNSVLMKTLLVVLALLALATGFWMASVQQTGKDPLISEDVGIVYPQARVIGDFELVDANGEPITEQRFADKWWVVYFGFTFCPDACPIALNDMNKIKANLPDNVADEVGFAFISVDPDRDTPERLQQYVSYFNPDFLGATGQAEDLEALAAKVGVVFFVPENPEDDNYIVDHSTALLLWNPLVNLQAIFTVPHDPEQIAQGITKIVENS